MQQIRMASSKEECLLPFIPKNECIDIISTVSIMSIDILTIKETMMAARIMKSDAVRMGWRDVLDDVADGDDILVERYNKPVAALIAYEDYIALQDELDDLRSARRAQAALEAWRKDPSLARPWEEIKAELHKRDSAEDEQ
jgi:prevent-host-death family protein